jgi:hypothetical protein
LKKTFSLIELIFVILIIGIVISSFQIKNNVSKLNLAHEQLILHLKYLRYIAMLDNKYDDNDSLWFRKMWTIKFLNCQKKFGGYYYVIYSDKNKNGAISKSESLKDPLTNNHIYSYQCKEDSLFDKSKFVLLTKEYGIKDIQISCNETNTIGQLSFSNNGNVYSKLATKSNKLGKYEIEEICYISLKDGNKNEKIIKIYPKTGFIE